MPLLIFFVLLGFSFNANADKMKSRGVGAGIAFPAPNHALFVNPANLTEAAPLSLQATYLIDPQSPHASLVGNNGNLGLGAGYRKNGSLNLEEFGVGIGFSKAALGVSLRTHDLNDFNADIGTYFDLSRVRVAGVARSLDGGIDRIDGSLGIEFNSAAVAFDLKKPLPLDSETWFMNIGFTATVDLFTVGMGYDFAIVSSEVRDGNFNAGLSIALMGRKFFLEGYYRPMIHEWVSSLWAGGIRIIF